MQNRGGSSGEFVHCLGQVEPSKAVDHGESERLGGAVATRPMRDGLGLLFIARMVAEILSE
jgi:hypothetical protein